MGCQKLKLKFQLSGKTEQANVFITRARLLLKNMRPGAASQGGWETNRGSCRWPMQSPSTPNVWFFVNLSIMTRETYWPTLLMWSLWVKIPTEYWHEPPNVSQKQKAASAWWARVTFVLLSELDGLPAGFLNLVEHLQQESVVTIARHPFWRQNLNQTKNISGAQELTPFHFRGPSPFGGKLFPWEILDWAGFRNQLMLMHPELGERHNLYCFKS